jgi:hypothetical protein
MDSLTVAAVADTFPFWCAAVILCIAVLSVWYSVCFVVNCFIKKKTVFYVCPAPKFKCHGRIKETLWALVAVIYGVIVRVLVTDETYIDVVCLLTGVGILSAVAAAFLIWNSLTHKRKTTSDEPPDVVARVTVEMLWVFWLVFSSYSIASYIIIVCYDGVVLALDDYLSFNGAMLPAGVALIVVKIVFIRYRYSHESKKN